MLAVHTSTTPIEDASRHLNALLKENRSCDVLLLFSGGSALSLLPHIDTTILGERITISVLDERYTFNKESSNMSALIADSFFVHARKQHVAVIDPRPEKGDDLLDTARRFDLALKHWHITHHDGVVIATMGVGADGHIAGILPFSHNPETFAELFQDKERCVRGYHVNPRISVHQDRITTTCTYLLRHINHAVVYMTGEEKKGALRAVLAPEGALRVTPARILNSMRDAHLYTDLVLS